MFDVLIKSANLQINLHACICFLSNEVKIILKLVVTFLGIFSRTFNYDHNQTYR